MVKKAKTKAEKSELSVFEQATLKELKRVMKLPESERRIAIRSVCNIVSAMKGCPKTGTFVSFFKEMIPLLDKGNHRESHEIVMAFATYILNTVS